VDVFAGEEDQRLQDGLSSLTPAQRTVLVLRFYLDWSVADTAKVLGKKPGTVRALTSQGIARLRESVTEREVQDDIRA
jgi:RNA polymerase sigma factor (sigma-70 family)